MFGTSDGLGAGRLVVSERSNSRVGGKRKPIRLLDKMANRSLVVKVKQKRCELHRVDGSRSGSGSRADGTMSLSLLRHISLSGPLFEATIRRRAEDFGLTGEQNPFMKPQRDRLRNCLSRTC